MKKTFYITTSIPYVNAAPHIGHALEFVIADVGARYNRLIGNDTFFLSGTDDYALKNVLKAEEAGEEISGYINRHADTFRKLLKDLNISNDDFIQTSTDARHIRGAQKLWSNLKEKDIEKKAYKGLYCVGCEDFKIERDLVDGCCPNHPNAKLETVEEENYFFKLGNYQKQLEELIESDKLEVVPETRKNEVLSFIRGGLEDISISRSVERAHGWGVKVPGDDTQVMYVWVDALSNYINALGYGGDDKLFQKYWPGVHVVGKDISRFHAIIWPALLLSAGVEIPEKVLVHGFITSGGQKMSKSVGNVIDPFELIEEYGAEAVRYYLLRHISTFGDGDLTKEGFKDVYNGELANGLGNLVSRIMKLSEDHLEEKIERPEVDSFPKEYTEALESFKLNQAADYIWSRVQALDRKITDTEPYKVIKVDEAKGREMIKELVVELYLIGRLLNPFLPEASVKIKEAVLANKKPVSLFERK
ncbi:MAG: methionine--tRNA ligase [Parcubacteria group bacterium]|nr:methionine--tRNA ligase [Parcubacteria group bacterium]